MIRWISRSAQETALAGQALADALRPGDIVCLDGDLGAGKTALTGGIARGLGIDAVVASPTFLLVAEYASGGRLPLYHFDAYRLSGAEDFNAAGLDEYFGYGGVCVVEWSDVVREVFTTHEAFGIRIEYREEGEREIVFAFPESRIEEAAAFADRLRSIEALHRG